MWDWIQREAIYLWYYLDIQIRQIAPYWVSFWAARCRCLGKSIFTARLHG